MSKINILNSQIANKIAAGEVIANPASVIKELLENSIDAQSSVITIEIKKGGKELILIKDNGTGIAAEDVLLAFKRHATSKINKIEDLIEINTLGFRGEALASIAAVSKIDINTRERSSNNGVHLKIHGGNVVQNNLIGCSLGTTIKVEDIFYNTPARYKYLKKDSVETGNISSIIERIALSHPEVSFRFINEGRQIFHTPGNNDLYSCIYCLYGKEFSNNLIELNYINSPLEIKGYIGKPQLTRATKKYQIFFVNNRYIKNKVIYTALEEAYKGLVMIHKHPIAILNINLPSYMLDINVHPAKTEILFRNESLIYLLIKQAILEHLKIESLIPEVRINNKNEKDKIINNYTNTQEQIPIESTIKERPSYNNYNNSIKEDIDKKSIYREVSDYNIERSNNSRDKDENKDNKKNNKKQKNLLDFKKGKIIGQVFSTYIIIEIENELLLIDQHAAHERIAYNQFKDQFNKNMVISQNLLIPRNIEVSYEEYQLIFDYLSILNRLGYDIEGFGSNSIILRSVPLILGQPQNEENLLEIIYYLQDLKDIGSNSEVEQKIISMACKSAIKAHDHLENREIYKLIEDLISTENPYTCPHGRPTIIKLTRYELEKLFKRIQQ
jgi:DNA mismatch repair protein MutL